MLKKKSRNFTFCICIAQRMQNTFFPSLRANAKLFQSFINFTSFLFHLPSFFYTFAEIIYIKSFTFSLFYVLFHRRLFIQAATAAAAMFVEGIKKSFKNERRREKINFFVLFFSVEIFACHYAV